jgi:hypothetical protein
LLEKPYKPVLHYYWEAVSQLYQMFIFRETFSKEKNGSEEALDS